MVGFALHLLREVDASVFERISLVKMSDLTANIVIELVLMLTIKFSCLLLS